MAGHGTDNYTRSARYELKAKMDAAKKLREEIKFFREQAKAELAAESEAKAPVKALRNILGYFKDVNQLGFVKDALKSIMQSEKAAGTDAAWKNYLVWKELRREERKKVKESKADKKRGAEAEAVKKDPKDTKKVK